MLHLQLKNCSLRRFCLIFYGVFWWWGGCAHRCFKYFNTHCSDLAQKEGALGWVLPWWAGSHWLTWINYSSRVPLFVLPVFGLLIMEGRGGGGGRLMHSANTLKKSLPQSDAYSKEAELTVE